MRIGKPFQDCCHNMGAKQCQNRSHEIVFKTKSVFCFIIRLGEIHHISKLKKKNPVQKREKKHVNIWEYIRQDRMPRIMSLRRIERVTFNTWTQIVIT